MFYMYVLECSDKTLYTGYTDNLEKRVQKHNSGKASKYTRSRLPVKLLASFSFETKSEAMKAEVRFKALSRTEKLEKLDLTP
ncbi:MAG: GIY-YIG nuclease family protein [Candidatus Aenigmarchaeota archaeon]|nr:GIY-YIG nuclease family protein [Candidatus Aenigmarchaeota archaeon]